MQKITYAARIDSEVDEIWGFQLFLDDINAQEPLARIFDFIGIPLVDVSIHTSDYELRFEDDEISLVLYNDDFEYKELGTTPGETIIISITANSEKDMEEIIKRLENRVTMVKIS